jgi:hypothetical protein
MGRERDERTGAVGRRAPMANRAAIVATPAASYIPLIGLISIT